MSQNKYQAAAVAPKKEVAPVVVAGCPAGLTPAWFTDRELLEVRKICRDHDGELGSRFLAEALKRASRD